jgi:sec-independent protein translocase protein TatC
MAVGLFYAGCVFAYFVVFPVVFAFFTSMAPEGVQVMTDINRYLDFVLALFLAFGLAFQVPVAAIVLVALRITTPSALGRMRGYVIVGAFTVSMLITPPDVISQTLLAVPVLLLYELGIVAARLLVGGDSAADDQASS